MITVYDAFAKGVQRVEDTALADTLGRFSTSMSFAMAGMSRRSIISGMSKESIDAISLRAAQYTSRLIAACESPIEREMAAPLVMANYEGFQSCPAIVHLPKAEERFPAGDLIIIPQMAVLKFRLDFGIIGIHEREHLIVALECDGAEFHQDKMKDWKKTKYLESAGIRVVRASGEEISADPMAVAQKVAAVLIEWKFSR